MLGGGPAGTLVWFSLGKPALAGAALPFIGVASSPPLGGRASGGESSCAPFRNSVELGVPAVVAEAARVGVAGPWPLQPDPSRPKHSASDIPHFDIDVSVFLSSQHPLAGSNALRSGSARRTFSVTPTGEEPFEGAAQTYATRGALTRRHARGWPHMGYRVAGGDPRTKRACSPKRVMKDPSPFDIVSAAPEPSGVSFIARPGQ